MSPTQYEGTHSPLSWFYWPWDLQQDFPFISSSRGGSSHHNLYPARVQVSAPRHNHRLRQLLNEDRSASLSHCTLTKLSLEFVCWSTLSPRSPLCFNIAILSKQVSSVSKSIRSVCLPGNLLTFYQEMYSGERVLCVIVRIRVPFINFAKGGGCLPYIWPSVHIWITLAGCDFIICWHQSG